MSQKFSALLAVAAVVATAAFTSAAAFNAPPASASSSLIAHRVAVVVGTEAVSVPISTSGPTTDEALDLKLSNYDWDSWRVAVVLPGKDIVKVGNMDADTLAVTPQDLVAGKVKAGVSYPVKVTVAFEDGRKYTRTTGNVISFKKATVLTSTQEKTVAVGEKAHYTVTLASADWKTATMVPQKNAKIHWGFSSGTSVLRSGSTHTNKLGQVRVGFKFGEDASLLVLDYYGAKANDEARLVTDLL